VKQQLHLRGNGELLRLVLERLHHRPLLQVPHGFEVQNIAFLSSLLASKKRMQHTHWHHLWLLQLLTKLLRLLQLPLLQRQLLLPCLS